MAGILLSHSNGPRRRSPWYDPHAGRNDSQESDHTHPLNPHEHVHEWIASAGGDGGGTRNTPARFAPAQPEQDEPKGDSGVAAIKEARYVYRRRKPMLSPVPGVDTSADIAAPDRERLRGFVRPQTPQSEQGGANGAAPGRANLCERGSLSNPESLVYAKEEGAAPPVLEQSHTTVSSHAVRTRVREMDSALLL